MNASLYSKPISISSVGQLASLKISRDQFLDPALKSAVAGKIADGEDILFLGNDIAESTRKNAYQLTIHGILPCGSKTTLTVNGIDPFVDVRLLGGESDSAARVRINRLVESGNEEDFSTGIQFNNGRDFLYYSHLKHRYARVHFRTLLARGNFISTCRSLNIKTYSNDRSTYYRVVSRGYEINLSGWNVIRGYRPTIGGPSKATYTLTIDVTDIMSITDDKDLAQVAVNQGFDPSLVKYENMIMCGFDIEMIPHRPGSFPDADRNPKDSIFMICMTYHFVKRKEAIFSVCLTLKEADPIDDALMVHCRSEACLLAAFARFMSFMQPDFITEFNGGGFDWRNVITKSRICGVLSTFLEDMSIVKLSPWEKTPSRLNQYHKEREIKIGGATPSAICKGLIMQGFVSFDTLVVFKQLEPNADSHKLNECLKRCNLGGKDDMEIEEMFRIYREGTSAEMKMVAHYCYIDTFKLQQLLIKKNVVQDRREVANLSYTSIHDNFYYAGGGRMRNLLMNRGAKLGYFFDTEYRPEVEDPDAKFPGAYVVPPVKGIVKPMLRFDEFAKLNALDISEDDLAEGYSFIANHFEQIYHPTAADSIANAPAHMKTYLDYTAETKNQYPVSGLDYASLYPSIIMAYNISPEKLIIDEDYANELMANGVELQYVSFPFCGKNMRSWFVRHNNVVDDYSICGKLLIELFDRRAAIKKVLKHYGESIFEMEQEMKPFIESNSLEQYPRFAEYEETQFDYVSYDSKQKAVKIFMNTLYGEMGNTISCICAVQVAGSVTAMGRHNLKLAKTFVEDKLFMFTYYGDTDSLYVSCNARHFMEHDREYFTGSIDKIAYGTRLVETTFEQIEIAKTAVNKHLIEDNGSKFLKMAYEEVLYPAAFLSKKKYYGVPHEENVDFYPRKLFLRGLEIVKRGASDVLKDVINEVLSEVMDLKTTRDLMDIVKQAIARVFNTDWPLASFAKTKSYRPDKKNISVQTMMRRYREMNYHTIPAANVRFKYVICKYYPWTYDIQGRQTKNTIGDCMELLDRVVEEGLEIDLEYYFDNELTGQFARLITFCSEVVVSPIETEPIDTSSMTDIEIDALNKELYTRSEDTLFKAAKKYIGQLAKHYSKAYVNRGSLFANTWREVCGYIRAHPETLAKHLTATRAVVIEVFANSTGDIRQDLFSWATRHIAKRYRTVLADKQADVLARELDKIAQFIQTHRLEPTLIDCSNEWKRQVVEFIRTEYDYEYICKNNLPRATMWDVLTRDELEMILADPAFFPQLNSDHAMTIIDMISAAIGCTLSPSQLSM